MFYFETGSEIVPSGLQGRVLFISYWAMCVVMYASFTAGLTTQLAVSNDRIYETIQEVLDDGYNIVLIKGSFHYTAIFEVLILIFLVSSLQIYKTYNYINSITESN